MLCCGVAFLTVLWRLVFSCAVFCVVEWHFELGCGVSCCVVCCVWCCVICCAVGWGGVLNCSVEFRVALCTVLWCCDIIIINNSYKALFFNQS